MGQAAPSWFTWLVNNKLYGCLMIFFISNAFETQLISTGAFEISLNNMPVWSKLESGRIPQPPELFQIIDNHFKMSAGGAESISFQDQL
jgi:selT/selW/selH-like putative selenoprotein